ncbi:hypothetical protein ACE1ET_00670 [Saccharicrinis sp. FJH62]|uniref:hypothetical protein n=1 Tax=Saccharicrinis sp. FJH62 TaxID=3344657 RepID=UPI0035D52127
MIKVLFCFFVLFIAVSPYVQAQNNVSFFEEHIDFEINAACFSVNGIYSFYNSGPQDKLQPITFPFASDMDKIDSVRIINLNTGGLIPFAKQTKAVSFMLIIPAGDTVDVNIFYRQKTSDINTYILTSTQAWGEPLKNAVYTLSTDADIGIKSFSYLPDSSQISNKKQFYFWEMQDFMPKQDFEIRLDSL